MTTPGVYIQEIEQEAPAQGFRMDVAGFVGLARRGPLDEPQLLESWGQFLDVFGGFADFGYLPDAVYGFFRNGGRRCHVVRVDRGARKARLQSGQGLSFAVEAINPGSWGNRILVRIEPRSSSEIFLTELAEDLPEGSCGPVRLKSAAGWAEDDEVALLHQGRSARLLVCDVDFANGCATFHQGSPAFFPAGTRVLGRGFAMSFSHQPQQGQARHETFDNLSLGQDHERYFARVINGAPEQALYLRKFRLGHSVLVRVEDTHCLAQAPSRPPALAGIELSGGREGMRPLDPDGNGFRFYTGYLNQAYIRPPQEGLAGLAALERVSEIGSVAIPDLIVEDLASPGGVEPIRRSRNAGLGGLANLRAGQRDLLWHCSRLGDRFALLDSPPGAKPGMGPDGVGEWANPLRALPEGRYGAFYYPWAIGAPSDVQGRSFPVPPSGHLAGVFARSDFSRGIGKAPANEVLQGVVDLEICLSDAQQDRLNPLGVNCLRALPGRGLRVWGARSLSLEPRHLYVNVRRLSLSVIKFLTLDLRWTVFEPNDRRLWDRIVTAVTLFMRKLFESGALAGARAEEAYFVQCDEETNPPESVELGRVIARVGFAPAKPAEYILVTIERTAQSIAVRESP